MNTEINVSNYKSNLRKIFIESLLTTVGAGFSVSIINLFWNSIGMDQTAIGLTQMIFTIVIFLLDIPMGYIADRFNRKLLNIIGDMGVALTFLFYAFAQNIYMAIISECLLGLFLAMTNGVDQSFMKYNCNKIDPSGQLFKKVNIKINSCRYVLMIIIMILGGFISKISLRLTIAMSFIVYFIGGLIALSIKDYAGKIEVKQKDPVLDMIHTIKDILKDKKVKAYVAMNIVGKEMTHAQIWVLTPLLIMVGVPMEIVSFGWVISEVSKYIGSKISIKMINFKVSNKFLIPALIEMLWIFVLVFNTNIFTVWIFGLNGLVYGIYAGLLNVPLQEATEDEVQTSVMSIVSTGARILYIPLVYFINYLGNIKLQLALLGVAVVFIPLCALIYYKLRKLEKLEATQQ